MFNFMMDEFVKKDRALAFREKQYQNNAISREELIVLPLLQPQDSLRDPRKFGLDDYQSQIEILGGNVPKCYQDTYGSYAAEVFILDCILLRNYLEISRLRELLHGFALESVDSIIDLRKNIM